VDPCDPDLVADLCPNEMIELYIDEESMDLISQQCSKSAYFWWHQNRTEQQNVGTR